MQPATEVTTEGKERGMMRGWFEIRETITGKQTERKKVSKKIKKVCRFKKVSYLCSPKRNGSQPTDVGEANKARLKR